MIGGVPVGHIALGGAILSGDPPPSPNGLSLRLGGALYTENVIDGSIRINSRLSVRDTLELEIADFSGTIGINPGQSVSLYRDGDLVFGGTVDSVSESFPSLDRTSTFKTIAIRCVDWNQLADRRIVTEGFLEQPAEDIVEFLVQNYLADDGVTTSGIKVTGIDIGPVTVNYRRLSEVLDQIAKLIGWDWNIDYEKEFQFFDRSTYSAPWNISDTNRPYESLVVSRGRNDYRNVQYLRGAKDTGAQRTREFSGDGDTSTWDVEFPIGEEPDVYVNDVAKTVGIRGVHDESDASGYDWFWAKGETAISQNTAATKLSGTDTLKVVFKPLIPIIVKRSDYAAIDDRQAVEGGGGLYEASAEDGQIEDAGLAYEHALGFLRRYARINTEIRVRTYSYGIRPGHLQTISIPAEGVDDQFLITSMTAREIGGVWEVTYRGINNELAGGWPEWFKRLAKSGADFKLEAERDIIKVYQASENFIVTDSDNSASGNSLSAIVNDDYTAAQIPTAQIGPRYEEEGVTYNRGSRIGEFVNLA